MNENERNFSDENKGDVSRSDDDEYMDYHNGPRYHHSQEEDNCEYEYEEEVEDAPHDEGLEVGPSGEPEKAAAADSSDFSAAAAAAATTREQGIPAASDARGTGAQQGGGEFSFHGMIIACLFPFSNQHS